MSLFVIPVAMFAVIMQAAGSLGTIQGTACELDGCKPILSARISVELSNSGGIRRTVSTNERGEFTFRELPPGRYQLEAQADRFYPVAVLPLVTLSDGGKVEDVHVFMRALGTISGRVLDQQGKPLRNARVDAMVFQQGIHLRMLVPVTGTSADDRGEFRLSGLAPDDYFVRITPPLSAALTDVYPPTCYPGATSPENASKIALSGGSELADIDIRVPLRGVVIAGRFVTQAGEPARATAYLIPRLTSPLVGPTFNTERSSEEFEIRGVPPGSYYLYAVTNVGNLNVEPVDRLPPQWVRVPIEVGNEDMKNLNVQIALTGSIIGRIVLSSDAVDTGSLDLSTLLIQAGPIEVTPGPSENYLAAKVSDIGEFRFDHLSEMILFLWQPVLNGDWFVSKLLLEGGDVMSSGFSTVPGQDRALEVVISNAGGNLKGIIKNPQNNPVPTGTVVLLPAPPLRSNPLLLRIALANDRGEFVIETIGPGEYTAIAFPPEGQFTPMFLRDVHWVEQYERFEQHVSVGVRQGMRVDLITATPNPN